MRFIFTSSSVCTPAGQKRRKIKTFNAFFITHCHCPPLATPTMTPPLAPQPQQRVLCGPKRNVVCPGDMSQQILLLLLKLLQRCFFSISYCCFFFFRKVSPLSQLNRHVVRGNLINCLETSTSALLLFWHKIPFYFHLPWPILA